MNAPITPPKAFPMYTFLVVDNDLATRQRACDIAAEISRRSPHAYMDDFSAPLQDALQVMFSGVGWGDDLGNPTIAGALPTPNGLPFDIMLSNLYTWHLQWFPPPELGRQALARANDAVMDAHNFVYRDATPSQMEPFLTAVPHRDIVVVKLSPDPWPQRYLCPTPRITHATIDTPTDTILERIMELA